MTEKHKHHIIPKHMGGDNSPENLTPPISVHLHAALHEDLFNHYGKTEDYIAWKKLSKQSLKGIMFTPEVRKKMSAAKTGRKLSEETKRKMSESGKGKNTTPHSDDRKRINSKAQKGKKLSPETCQKMSVAMRGHEVSIEARKKIGDAQRGKILSEKTKLQIAQSKSQLIIFDGRTQSFADWAKELGMTKAAIRYRLKIGWSVQEALTTPKYEKILV